MASSYSTAPRAYRSARWSTARPVRPVASGARYASVPTIWAWWVNSGRISATDDASAKSTRHGTPAPERTTFAEVMSRCITPRRCIPATARARSSPSPVRSSAGSGLVTPARLASPASSSTTDPGYRASSASWASPLTPRSRSSIAASCRTRRSASAPSGSLRITVRPGRNSRVMRMRPLSCTISTPAGGSRAGSIPPDPIRHLHAGQTHLILSYTRLRVKGTGHQSGRNAVPASRPGAIVGAYATRAVSAEPTAVLPIRRRP